MKRKDNARSEIRLSQSYGQSLEKNKHENAEDATFLRKKSQKEKTIEKVMIPL